MTEDVIYSKPELVALLKNNVVNVEFTKTDGNIRFMECTLIPEFIPKGPSVKEEQPGKKLNENVLSVWDTEKNDWRSFRINSLKKVKVLENE